MRLDELIKQKAYEKPVLILRSHPIIFFGNIILFAILAAIPYVLYQLFSTIYPLALNGPYGYPLVVLAVSVYYLSIWLFLFSEFIDFYLDVWIVTNDRIVNIIQQGLFARTISELDLYKVQDVTSEIKGALPTFFNYGNVYIQTAGEKERFIFKNVHRPHDIRKQIVDLIEVDRSYHKKDMPTP